MAKLTNLGDLIDRSRDLEKIALIDLGGEVPGREYSFATIDTLDTPVASMSSARAMVASSVHASTDASSGSPAESPIPR